MKFFFFITDLFYLIDLFDLNGGINPIDLFDRTDLANPLDRIILFDSNDLINLFDSIDPAGLTDFE